MSESTRPGPTSSAEPRRDFLVTGTCMAGGLVASYGSLGAMAVRFLYPSGPGDAAWQFVKPASEIAVGDSFAYVAPNGAKVVIARHEESDAAESFIALSSVCPHLGCKVHWEPVHDRFFCPCHNGAFDPEGNPIEGPPKSANQQLTRFPLKIESGLLYILAPTQSPALEA